MAASSGLVPYVSAARLLPCKLLLCHAPALMLCSLPRQCLSNRGMPWRCLVLHSPHSLTLMLALRRLLALPLQAEPGTIM